MPISTRTSRSGRSRGSSTASGLEGASHCILWFTRAGPFVLNAFPRWSGQVFDWLHYVLVSSRHDFSYLLHQHCRVTSLRIIQFPCMSWISIGEDYAVQSSFCLHFLLTPMTLATSKTRILNQAAFTLPTPHSLVWLLPPSSTFKLWQRARTLREGPWKIFSESSVTLAQLLRARHLRGK